MMNLKALAEQLNATASSYKIGELQDIRVKLQGLSRRPTKKIFTSQTIHGKWAFHHGGRKEIQFNIGLETIGGLDYVRHGIAFSLERSQTLPSIDVLIPKIRRFNEYLAHNAAEFSDFRMWHWTRGKRSNNYSPAPIPHELVQDRTFIFLGDSQLTNNVDQSRVLRDMDRLLPLYLFVESKSGKLGQGNQQPRFHFIAGCKSKPSHTKASQAERSLSVKLRHNDLQQTLFDQLVERHGTANVGTELQNGIGGSIDVVVRAGTSYKFYEVKVGFCVRSCIREAIGQLLEYSYWPNTQKPTEMIIAGEAEETAEAAEYLQKLGKTFGLPLSYLKIDVGDDPV